MVNHFISVQFGARRNYAVPAILEEAGMLEFFYTDLCADVGIGKWLNRWSPYFLRRGLIKNFLSRQLPSNLTAKTKHFPLPTLKYLIKKSLAVNNPQQILRIMSEFNEDIGNAMVAQGLSIATHLFTMLGEGTPLLRYAKDKGLTTITEIYILLNAYYIVRQERQKFPDLEPESEEEEAGMLEVFEWLREVCRLSDWFIVPSEKVRQDLEENFGVEAKQCFVVPYAVNSMWLNLENSPQKGRILFVGTAEIRKGIHIFAAAANLLKNRGYEFRVAGSVSPTIRNHPLMKNLTFLGRVPRQDIQQEYQKADIFVLPSLAEGSAEVTYEALAVGVPVITTSATGSVVRNELDGFIVPEGDEVRLAAKIEGLIENRELRNQMAKLAKERAKDYTWSQYSQRLIYALQSI